MNSSVGIFPRDLTDEERQISLWMIEHGTGDTKLFDDHLAKATVVSACGCGCPSIDFAIGGKEPDPESKMELFGDYFYGTDDDLCGAFVFACDGQLAGIEFYPLAADEVPAKIPLPDSLRPAVFNQTNSEQESTPNLWAAS